MKTKTRKNPQLESAYVKLQAIRRHVEARMIGLGLICLNCDLADDECAYCTYHINEAMSCHQRIYEVHPACAEFRPKADSGVDINVGATASVLRENKETWAVFLKILQFRDEVAKLPPSAMGYLREAKEFIEGQQYLGLLRQHHGLFR